MQTCRYTQVSATDRDGAIELIQKNHDNKMNTEGTEFPSESPEANCNIDNKLDNNLNAEGFSLYKDRWIVLAIFSLISMTNEVIWISLSSITSIVKEYYGVSYIAVNWLSMIYMLFYVFVVFAVYVLDRKGLKFTIVVGAVLNGLGSCLRLIGANRDGFVLTFLGNASAALAQCFILFVPPTLAATWFGENERATASAIGVLMNMLGVAIGFLMGGTMVPSSKDYDGVVRKGMFNTLIAQAVFCTIMVICCVVFVKDAPKTPPSMSQLIIIKSKQHKLNEKKKKKKQLSVKSNGFEKENMTPTTIAENSAIKKSCLETSAVKLQDSSDVSHADVTSSALKEVDKRNSNDIEGTGFILSLKILSRDKTFHLVTQAYGFYFGLFAAYNTVLNQMCMVHYPGKEKEIGLMGFTSVLLGLIGIFLAGVWLDKTKKYKLISVVTFVCCSVSLLWFTFLLVYGGNFIVVYISFSVFGFFSYPYITIGLEHAAELAYPVSEGITSGILLLMGNMYGIILTFITGALIENGRSDIAGYLMTVFYLVGLACVIALKGDLKRLKADHSNDTDTKSVIE